MKYDVWIAWCGTEWIEKRFNTLAESKTFIREFLKNCPYSECHIWVEQPRKYFYERHYQSEEEKKKWHKPTKEDGKLLQEFIKKVNQTFSK